jgi:glycosyltransferase involved in cell wall biosynthesis
MLSITYFYREPRKTGVSIEGIFKLVADCLKEKVNIREYYCDPNRSRLQNTLRAGKFSSEINHITGDVHFLALGLRGKKNVLTVHDLGHYDTLKKRSFFKHLVYKLFWYQYPLKYINIVTVVSEFTKRKLIEYFNVPEEKIRIIYDPIKPVFQYSKKEEICSQPKILMLGTGKHKNLNNLIEATKNTGFHLDIIGWPSDEELTKLKSYQISNTVYNRLSDEDVYKRYLECDVLFFASFYEGFGMPIVEAQSVGRPVITSNIGAMKEVAGNSAVLVDPNSPDEIKNAIMKLVNDKKFYDEVVEKGRENIAPYQSEIIAGKYLDVYMELA